MSKSRLNVAHQDKKAVSTAAKMVIFLVSVHSLKRKGVNEDLQVATLSVTSVIKWVICRVSVQIKIVNKIEVVLNVSV